MGSHGPRELHPPATSRTALAGAYFTPQDPRFQTGTYPDKVPSYTTLDLFGRYTFTPNFTVSASILNIMDETPPYDPGFSSTYPVRLHAVRHPGPPVPRRR